MPVEETGRGIIRITPEQFPPCYALLKETFHAEELNSRTEMLADLSLPVSKVPADQFVMLAHLAIDEKLNYSPNTIVSLIAGCYLVLDNPKYNGQSIGFIEYLVTRAAFRQQGYATCMLFAFEKEMLRIAGSRGERLCMILGEVVPELVDFKLKRGYHRPRASCYAQPPIAFNQQTGQPLAAVLPMVLMAKSWDRAIEADLLLHAVQVIFEKRYVPKNIDEQAAHNVMAYINEYIYAPFAASLQVDGGFVMMN